MNSDRELSERISRLKDLGAKYCQNILLEDEKMEMDNLLSEIYNYILNQQGSRSVQTEQINSNRREILAILNMPANTDVTTVLSNYIDNLWQYSGAQI